MLIANAKVKQSNFPKAQRHLSPALSPNKIGGEGERGGKFALASNHFKRQ